MTRSRHRQDRNPAAQQSPAVVGVCYPFGRKHGRDRALNRREVISLLGGAAAAWPLSARAQQPMPVVGFLYSLSPEPIADRLRGFRQGLRDAGFVEGENVIILFRWAENQIDRLSA